MVDLRKILFMFFGLPLFLSTLPQKCLSNDSPKVCQEVLTALEVAVPDLSERRCFKSVQQTIQNIKDHPHLDLDKAKVMMITSKAGALGTLRAKHTIDSHERVWTYHFIVLYDHWVIDTAFGMIPQAVDLSTYFRWMYGDLEGLEVKVWTGKDYLKKINSIIPFLQLFPLSPQAWIGFQTASSAVETYRVQGPSPKVKVLKNGVDNQPRKPVTRNNDSHSFRLFRGGNL